MQRLNKYIQLPKGIAPKIFIICLLGILTFNIVTFYQEHARIQNLRKYIPHQLIGQKLTGLETYTKGIPLIGYFTDAPENDDAQAKLFSYAQYLVTPTILDYKNLNHEYILFVCSNETTAKIMMQQINAEAIIQNKFGIILARRKL